MEPRIEERSPDAPEARALLAAYYEELRARFDIRIDLDEVLALGDMKPPRGALLVVFDQAGSAVACGAVRWLDEARAEVKRMFVRPDARRRGLARRLLAALEARARARGATRMLLDTDSRDAEAVALYLREGYARVPAYNDNADADVWFEKVL